MVPRSARLCRIEQRCHFDATPCIAKPLKTAIHRFGHSPAPWPCVNAVSLNLPITSAVLAPALQGTTAPTGFPDLINLLLAIGPSEPEPPAAGVVASPQDSFAGSTPVLSITSTATPDQIASALIRFMLKGKQVSEPKKSLPIKLEPASAAIPSQNIFVPGKLNSAASIVMAALQEVAITPNSALAQDSVPVAPGSPVARPTLTRPSVTGPEVASPRGDGGKAGVSLNAIEASANPKTPVTFEMQLTPVADPQIAIKPGPVEAEPILSRIQPTTPDHPQPVIQPVALPGRPIESQTAVKASPTTSEPRTLEALAEPPADPQMIGKPDSAPVLPSTPSGPPLRLTPAAQPARPATPATAPAPVPHSPEPSDGNQPGSSGSQAKPREEQPAKVLAAAAASAPGDPFTQANAFPAGLQALAPQTAHPAPLPAEIKTIAPTSTPLSSTDTKEAAVKLPQSSGPTQQIEVRISQPQAPPVDLQIAQRAGQIQVVVRTADAGLETSLRQDLNTLVHSLERSGFHAETFVPIAAANASDSSRMNSQRDSQQAPPDSSQNRILRTKRRDNTADEAPVEILAAMLPAINRNQKHGPIHGRNHS